MWGIQPSEFWSMTMAEWWLIYDAKIGEPRYGSLSETDTERLYQELMNGGFGRTQGKD